MSFPERRTAENYPFRHHKGLKPMSLKKWLADEPLNKERRAMKRPEYQGKSDGQLAYEAGHKGCEVFPILDEIAPKSWLRFHAQNEKSWPLWNTFETHHVHGRDFKEPNEPWNLVRTCAGVHKYLHGKPEVARVVTYLAKEAAGQFDPVVIYSRTGRNPLAFVEGDVRDGKLSGRLLSAAKGLLSRHPFVPCREETDLLCPSGKSRRPVVLGGEAGGEACGEHGNVDTLGEG